MGFIIGIVIGSIAGAVTVYAVVRETVRRTLEQHRANIAEREVIRQAQDNTNTGQAELQRSITAFQAEYTQFNSRRVTYDELRYQNDVLRKDLRNIFMSSRKTQLDVEQQRSRQEDIAHRVSDLGARYLKDQVKWIAASLNQNNFVACKERLKDAVERCRAISFEVTAELEAEMQRDLRKEYEMVLRVVHEREEQARIKAQIREEQIREREIKENQKELERLARERQAYEAALRLAVEAAKSENDVEVERLKAQLAKVEEECVRRTVSQAELTKSGHVYVISNIGAFGEGVFKVGMTRRLEPQDRIRELGDASVPFPFDVHMLISCNDAPALENALHRALHKNRINKINPRKEFFRVDLTSIIDVVRRNHGEIEHIADAPALEYRQSLTMTDEDQEFIESVYEELDEEDEAAAPKV
jgi:hypothetical protein